MKARFTAACLSLCLLLCGCTQELPEQTAAPGADLPGETAAASKEEQPAEPEPLLPEVFSLPYSASAALDPITCPDGAQQTVGSLIFEGLYELDERLEPQGVLCASAEYDPAALTWTLRLREGAAFSDGSALTAADVSATLQRAMTSRRYQARLACVKSVRAVRGTVAVTLNRPNTGFLSLLDIPIVKAGTERTAPLGTGPYALTEDADGPCLTANPHWWKGESLPAQRIGLVDCAGEDDIRYQFTTHAVQLMTADLTGVNSFTASGDVDVWDADTTILQYIGFNGNRGAFQTAEARRALGTDIDRETIAGVYLSGHALPAQFPISPASPLYPKALETPYSAVTPEGGAGTATLPETAAVPEGGEEAPLTLLVNGDDPFKVSVAGFLASSLSGYAVTVDARPWEEYQAALTNREYDLYYGEVRLTADWDLSALMGTGGALNLSGVSDAAVDGALTDFAASPHGEADAKALCAVLAQQAPILPLCFKRVSFLTQPGVVEGLTPTAANPFRGPGGVAFHLAPAQ